MATDANTTHATTSAGAGSGADDTPPFLTDKEMRRFERKNLQAALKAGHGKIYGPDGAADLLGIKPSTLASRMKIMGVKKPPSS